MEHQNKTYVMGLATSKSPGQNCLARPVLHRYHIFKLLAGLVLAATVTLIAQSPRIRPILLPQLPLDPSMPATNNHSPRLDGPLDLAREARRIHDLNILRQKAIVNNAAEIVRLARELNDAVSARNSRMPVEQRLRKVAQIEKLAKAVKENMRYAGAPTSDSLIDLTRIPY